MLTLGIPFYLYGVAAMHLGYVMHIPGSCNPLHLSARLGSLKRRPASWPQGVGSLEASLFPKEIQQRHLTAFKSRI